MLLTQDMKLLLYQLKMHPKPVLLLENIKVLIEIVFYESVLNVKFQILPKIKASRKTVILTVTIARLS